MDTKKAIAIMLSVAVYSCQEETSPIQTEWYAESQGKRTHGIVILNASQEPMGSWQLRNTAAENWVAIPDTVIDALQIGNLGFAPEGTYEINAVGVTTRRQYETTIELPPPPFGTPLPQIPEAP